MDLFPTLLEGVMDSSRVHIALLISCSLLIYFRGFSSATGVKEYSDINLEKGRC